jgi:hypothetical protein
MVGAKVALRTSGHMRVAVTDEQGQAFFEGVEASQVNAVFVDDVHQNVGE